MRKITLLTTATLLSAAFIGSRGMTVQAAPAYSSQFPAFDNCKNFGSLGNKIVISGNPSNLQSILDKAGANNTIEAILKDCLENLPPQLPSLPACPPTQLPDTETPDNKPDTDKPDTESPDSKPETDRPGTEKPDNKPENDKPDNETPDSKPDTDRPGTEKPDNKPETDKPDNETPDSKPDTDRPGTEKPDNKPETDKPGTEKPDSKPETDRPETENQAYINRVVELVNTERAKEGLSPLSVDLNVQAAAQVRALEIETSFSHTRPNGSSFSTALKEQNVSYRSAGENIAWGQRSPEEVVSAWMGSADHRANIMDKNYTKIGVGYHQNARGTNYWSQLFIQ